MIWVNESGHNFGGVLALPDYLSEGALTLALFSGDFSYPDGGLYSTGDVFLLEVVLDDGGVNLVQREFGVSGPNPWSPAVVTLSSGLRSLVYQASGTSGNHVEEILPASDGTLQLSDPIAGDGHASINGLAVGDLFGDGTQELVASNFYEHSVSISRGDGQGSFAPWQVIPIDGAANGNPRLADFDGTGTNSIAVPDGTDFLTLIWPLADGGLVATNGTGLVGPFPYYLRKIVAGDLNGDGALDIAAAAADGANYAPGVTILYNACP